MTSSIDRSTLLFVVWIPSLREDGLMLNWLGFFFSFFSHFTQLC